MNVHAWVVALLVLAVLLGGARAAWLRRRQDPAARPRPWRTAMLLLVQLASAVLLYLVLFPPPTAREAGTLVVLTAGAGDVDPADTRGEHVVALPEAGIDGGRAPGATRVPDLATALRRFPQSERIRVLGAGLVARDSDAARGHALEFEPAALPRGVVELHAPTQVPAGRGFRVSGRGHLLQGGAVELLDPSGDRVDRSALDARGRFELHGAARVAGYAAYRLRVRDAQGRDIEALDVPLEVAPPRTLQVLVLAGAPNPELKYLRRWARDAGAVLDTRISLGAGMRIGTAPTGLDADSLDRLDLVVLDQRSWRVLDAGQVESVSSAVNRGLGLLLRLDAPLTGADRDRLRGLGFAPADADPPREVRLGGAFERSEGDDDALPALTRGPAAIVADDVVVLLGAANDYPLALWRVRGRGRIGVSMLTDSYRLVLGGHDDVHGDLWARMFGTLARADAASSTIGIEVSAPRQRSVICGIGEDARVLAPDGRAVALHVDPATGVDRCAGFWAESAGWHRLQDQSVTRMVHVPDAAAAPGITAHALREATLALAGAGAGENDRDRTPAAATRPGPRWPWFLGWLALTAAGWWFERSRRGRARAATPP